MSQNTNRDDMLRLGEILNEATGIAARCLHDDLVQARLSRRMREVGARTLKQYISLLERSQQKELQQFINLMTTNHTYFFREEVHLQFLQQVFVPQFFKSGKKSVNIWCAACSTGEEVYTVGMVVLKAMREHGIAGDVRVTGSDINTEALRIAKNGVYPRKRLENVPKEYRASFFKQGRFPHDGFFRVNDELRKIVRFSPINLIKPVKVFQKFDLIFCRNVLIYFEDATVRAVVRFLRSTLESDAVMITGLSESVSRQHPDLVSLGRSIYVEKEESPFAQSSVFGTKLSYTGSQGLTGQILNSQGSQTSADTNSKSVSATVNTSVGSTNKANYTSSSSAQTVSEAPKLPKMSSANLVHPNSSIDRLIVIGSSTGGVEALTRMLKGAHSDSPPIVIAQHIPLGYEKNMAETLSRVTSLRVQAVGNGERLNNRCVYIAPGGSNLRLRRSGDGVIAQLRKPATANRFVPCVDVLFSSAAELSGVQVAAAILTGMGNDGVNGARALRAKGFRVIAQNQETSLVYGMPGAAVAAKVVDLELPLDTILASLYSACRRASAKDSAA